MSRYWIGSVVYRATRLLELPLAQFYPLNLFAFSRRPPCDTLADEVADNVIKLLSISICTLAGWCFFPSFRRNDPSWKILLLLLGLSFALEGFFGSGGAVGEVSRGLAMRHIADRPTRRKAFSSRDCSMATAWACYYQISLEDPLALEKYRRCKSLWPFEPDEARRHVQKVHKLVGFDENLTIACIVTEVVQGLGPSLDHLQSLADGRQNLQSNWAKCLAKYLSSPTNVTLTKSMSIQWIPQPGSRQCLHSFTNLTLELEVPDQKEKAQGSNDEA